MTFKTIALDPPWAETGGGKICRGAQKHYDVVKDKDMLDVIRNAPCWTPDEAGFDVVQRATELFHQPLIKR